MGIGRWITGKLQNVATDTQRGEMQRFVESLRGMGAGELGMLLLWANTFRIRMEPSGLNLCDPINAVALNPNAAINLTRTVQGFQKEGRMSDAAALMVWVHTVRGAINPELRFLARQMWGELLRGAPFLQEANLSCIAMMEANGRVRSLPHLDGADVAPIGFEPQPNNPQP